MGRGVEADVTAGFGTGGLCALLFSIAGCRALVVGTIYGERDSRFDVVCVSWQWSAAAGCYFDGLSVEFFNVGGISRGNARQGK